MVDVEDIIDIFNAILNDPDLLDEVQKKLIEDTYRALGFHLLDREIEELDFNELL